MRAHGRYGMELFAKLSEEGETTLEMGKKTKEQQTRGMSEDGPNSETELKEEGVLQESGRAGESYILIEIYTVRPIERI